MTFPGDKTTYSTANVRWTLSIARQMVHHRFDAEGDLKLVLDPRYDEEEFSDEIGKRWRNVLPNTESATDDASKLEMPMLVSSNKLKLASPVFQAMLRPQFREGYTLSSTGSTDIYLPEDDPAPLSILLSIIHGNTKNIPHRIDLELMSEISVLVDKYQLHEAVAMNCQSWADELSPPRPMPSYKEILQYLCISSVFRRYEDLDILINCYMWFASGIIGEEYNPDLPIPPKIFEHANQRRIEALGRFFADIKAYIGKYYGESKQCNRKHPIMQSACDAMVLGKIIQALARAGMWPIPSAPFHGFSGWDLERQMKKLEIKTLCDFSHPHHVILTRVHANPKRDLYAIWERMRKRELIEHSEIELKNLL